MGRKKRFKWEWAVIAAAAAVAAGYAVYAYRVLPEKGTDLVNVLVQQGYTLNEGFSGVFAPGNLIQVAEAGSDRADRLLATPLVFAWASDCYPGQAPRRSAFTVPQTTGRSKAGLTIGAKNLGRILPTLRIESGAVVDYSLKVGETQVRTLAKGDISGAMSEKCVAALRRALDGGEKLEWYRVVVEAVVADSVELEVRWKANATAEARKAVVEGAGSSMAKAVQAPGKADAAGNAAVKVEREDAKETVISAKGAAIIAYRARPMQPIRGD